MPFSIRNIIIFVGLAVVFTSIYVFFIKSPSEDANLVSNSVGVSQGVPNVSSNGGGNALAQNFLSLLLNIKNIRLNDEIFSDPAFKSLRDSSIVLVPDSNTGRVNPFAQFGSDPAPVTPTTSGASSGTTTPVTPSATPATSSTGASTTQ